MALMKEDLFLPLTSRLLSLATASQVLFSPSLHNRWEVHQSVVIRMLERTWRWWHLERVIIWSSISSLN